MIAQEDELLLLTGSSFLTCWFPKLGSIDGQYTKIAFNSVVIKLFRPQAICCFCNVGVLKNTKTKKTNKHSERENNHHPCLNAVYDFLWFPCMDEYLSSCESQAMTNTTTSHAIFFAILILITILVVKTIKTTIRRTWYRRRKNKIQKSIIY